jgi:outer membrane protein
LDLVLSKGSNYNSGSLNSPADLSTHVNSNQAGLQLNIPLYAGGGTQSRVREALALEDKAREELILARRTTTNQVRQAFSGISSGKAQVEALKTAVEAGRNAVESNKIGFRIGTRIIPDVLNAEQQLYASMRDLSKARAETAMQYLKLKAAAGTLAYDDLVYLDQTLSTDKKQTIREE